jgi:hypothetical protein
LQHPNKFIKKKEKTKDKLWGTKPKPKKTKIQGTCHCLIKNLSWKTPRDKTKDKGKRVQWI